MGLGVGGQVVMGLVWGGACVGHSQTMGDQPCQRIQCLLVFHNPWCVFQVPGRPGGVLGVSGCSLENQDTAQLSFYCHYVAGCSSCLLRVGMQWTEPVLHFLSYFYGCDNKGAKQLIEKLSAVRLCLRWQI